MYINCKAVLYLKIKRKMLRVKDLNFYVTDPLGKRP